MSEQRNADRDNAAVAFDRMEDEEEARAAQDGETVGDGIPESQGGRHYGAGEEAQDYTGPCVSCGAVLAGLGEVDTCKACDAGQDGDDIEGTEDEAGLVALLEGAPVPAVSARSDEYVTESSMHGGRWHVIDRHGNRVSQFCALQATTLQVAAQMNANREAAK